MASRLQSARGHHTTSWLPWTIAGLLFFATLLNYLDREVLSVVSPILRRDFTLSATAYSHLLAAFLLGYTLLQPLAGRFTDQVGARLGLLTAMLGWSGATILASFAHSPRQLGFILFLMGAGESANWPASVKTIKEWFPPAQQGTAIGFFNCGSSVGALLAPILITALALRFSWRASFLAAGAVGLLWAIPWLVLFRRETHCRNTSNAPGRSSAASWFRVCRTRNALALMGARFFGDPVWIFFIFWLPDYLSRSRHFSMQRIGATAWLPFATAGLGNLCGGYLSGALIRRGISPRAARLRVMGMAAVLMLLGAPIAFISSPMLAISAISVVTFAYSCWAANILTLPSDLFPDQHVASVVGLSGMAAGGGSILVMLLVGFLVDRFSYIPALIGISCLPLLALSFAHTTVDEGQRAQPTQVPRYAASA